MTSLDDGAGVGSKRKATSITVDGDVMEIRPLGAGQEVGRSCVMLKYRGKTVMLDCGIHPGYAGLNGLPFFDEVEPSSIDLLLVSHFHLDHAAALPYFLDKTDFKGKVFMTHPTKAIYKMLLTDYLKVSNLAIQNLLYDEQSIAASMNRIEVLNYHQELEHNGIRFWCYNAGHVLGAAMFMIEIAGARVLYTGDYSREEDRHLMSAELPPLHPDVLIVEATYGVQVHQPREVREARFTTLVHQIVARGGRCLIPSFALGRAQELLLILDEYWQKHAELQHVPIFYASSLAKRCMAVYQTYIHMMNEHIRAQFNVANPFNFKFIFPMKSIESFHDTGPSVVMASPGMLQSGLSRDLLERWAPDKRNGCIIPGYVVEGTLAKEILTSPPDFVSSAGLRLPLHLSVEYISFSAHSDFKQTADFVDHITPPYVVLVHGESTEMGRLRSALVNRYEGRVQVLTPKTGQAVELKFRADKMAKTLGRLADDAPSVGTRVGGVLVRRNFSHLLMAPADLHQYTQLPTAALLQRLTVAVHRPLAVVPPALADIYEAVEPLQAVLQKPTEPDAVAVKPEADTEKKPAEEETKPPADDAMAVSSSSKTELMRPLRICGLVSLRCSGQDDGAHLLTLEWLSDPFADMLADSIVAALLQLDSSPAPVVIKTEESTPESVKPLHENTAGFNDPLQKRRHAYQRVLASLFGALQIDPAQPDVMRLAADGEEATVNVQSREVTSGNAALKVRVEKALQRVELRS